MNIRHKDSTSVPLIKQEERFSLAVRTIRSRLGLTQAEFASKIGRNQNTVSGYEAGKLQPSGKALAALWGLADSAERHLLMAHLTQEFSLFDKEQQRELLQIAEEGAREAGRVPPSVLARMFRVCKKYEKEPDAAQLINLAASWLEVEFEMRRMATARTKKVRAVKD